MNNRFWKDSEILVRVNKETKYRLMLEQTLDMLEYAHSTSEQYYDYRGVKKFIGEMYKALEDK